MKLSKTLLLIPAASFVFAAMVGAGACSSSTTITLTPDTPIPAGVTFGGAYAVGGDCKGDVYVEATSGQGFLICDDGEWTYDADLPTGYTVYTGGTTITITSGVPVPAGDVFPDGLAVGEACSGDVYVPASTGAGYLVCYDGSWTYDTALPSGYTIDTDVGDDSGFEADASGDDSSFGDDSGDDSGFGDDASEDGGSGDDSATGDDAAEDGGSGDDSSTGDAGDDSGG